MEYPAFRQHYYSRTLAVLFLDADCNGESRPSQNAHNRNNHPTAPRSDAIVEYRNGNIESRRNDKGEAAEKKAGFADDISISKKKVFL